MAVCNTNTLLASGRLFQQLGGGLSQTVRLALLKNILLSLSPTANTSVNALLASGVCFTCLTPGERRVVKLQLLCNIINPSSSSGGSGGGGSTCNPVIPTNLAIDWDSNGPTNYRLTWSVTRAPLVGFNLLFGNTQGGPYVLQSIPPQSGVCSYVWTTNANNPLTPASNQHQDMYLIVEFNDGPLCTADSPEFHGVYTPS